MVDVQIIGAGPAGLSAALYAARAGLSVRLFDPASGGQLLEAAEVENYPGVGRVRGETLAASFRREALAAGAQLVPEQVESAVRARDGFSLKTPNGCFFGRALILANGAEPRRLNVEGEQELRGRGVSYCAVCDGRFFGGKRVAVVGGGDSALSEALYLSRVAAAVHVLYRGERFRGSSALLSRLAGLPQVVLHTDCRVRAIRGRLSVEAVELEGGEELRVQGVFVAIGREPRNAPFANLFPLDERGYVAADENGACGAEGLFAAGDTRAKALRQITTAVADGANAAENARRYLTARAVSRI
ncbi:MAG: FAD-dependent oxidoreductase [Clostridia bacterium]|nr:FAD-dependent oxidoreductase [Clostridia bacterium]